MTYVSVPFLFLSVVRGSGSGLLQMTTVIVTFVVEISLRFSFLVQLFDVSVSLPNY